MFGMHPLVTGIPIPPKPSPPREQGCTSHLCKGTMVAEEKWRLDWRPGMKKARIDYAVWTCDRCGKVE